ncbi:hypothetical protein ACFLZW_03410 [Chloroflexota bacterium]
MKLSQNKKIILGLLSVILFTLLVIGIWVVYDLFRQQQLVIEPAATTADISITSTDTASQQISPTPTFTLTSQPAIVSTLMPTSTPIVVPSLTSIVKVPAKTTKPNSTQENSICATELAEALSTHQFNLSVIDETYQPQLAQFQTLLDQANADNDTLAIQRLTRDMQALQAIYDAAIEEENERYESEKTYIEFRHCK